MAMAVGWWLLLVAAAAYGAMVAEKHSTPCDGIPVAPHTNRNGERINERNSHTGCGRSLWKRRPSTKVNGRGLVGWLLACLQNPLENTLTKHIYYVSDFFSIFLFYFVSFWVAFFLSGSLCLWCFRCFHSHDKRHWSILDNNSNQIDSMIFEKFRRNRRDWIDTNGVHCTALRGFGCQRELLTCPGRWRYLRSSAWRDMVIFQYSIIMIFDVGEWRSRHSQWHTLYNDNRQSKTLVCIWDSRSKINKRQWFDSPSAIGPPEKKSTLRQRSIRTGHWDDKVLSRKHAQSAYSVAIIG